jgi:hypothetical protein
MQISFEVSVGSLAAISLRNALRNAVFDPRQQCRRSLTLPAIDTKKQPVFCLWELLF